MIYQPRKMLITGSAGFIGSHFVRQTLQRDPTVFVISLDKLTYASDLKNLADLPHSHRHVFIKGNICNADLLRDIFIKHDIDTVVHFAAESHVDRSIENPHDFIETNVLGTFYLLQMAKQIWLTEKKWSPHHCRFHHVSTDEVYGSLKKGDAPFTETHPYQPNSPYSASKAGSDHLVRAFAHTYGLPTAISHCSNNYGPYQHSEKLIPTIIRMCLQKTMIPIYGDGSNIRDWIFVEDHCEAIDLIIRQGLLNHTYNIGGQCEVSNVALAQLICELMDQRFPDRAPHQKHIQFVDDRLGHDWRYAIDNHKIKNELSWFPETSLRMGLQRTIDFYCDKKIT